MKQTRARRCAVRLYSALLRLYPPRYLADYADELRAVFALMVAESPRGVLPLLLRELRDLPAALWATHIEEGTMHNFLRAHAAHLVVAGMALMAMLCATLGSVSLWGYPLAEPGIESYTRQIACVQHAAEVSVDNALGFTLAAPLDADAYRHRADLYRSGMMDLRGTGWTVINATYPPVRGMAAVAPCLHLAASPFDAAALDSAAAVLASLDLGLFARELPPTDPNTPTLDPALAVHGLPTPDPALANEALHGYWLAGDAATGDRSQRVALLSLTGWVADDTYVQNDILLRSSDGGHTYTLADHQRYRYGMAGLEFMTFPFMALLCLVGLGCVALAVMLMRGAAG